MSSSRLLEVACFTLESALIAQSAGADRIELCENYGMGGLTPSEETILKARASINIPLHVMIRPRGSNFIYSEQELEKMKTDILLCKAQGVNAVVFGVLTEDRSVDVQVCRQLTELARPMSVTFHRAIDSCKDIKRAFEKLVLMGVDRILSSGRGADAERGLVELIILQKQFGEKIVIMPGGGIRTTNLRKLLSSGCREFHTSAITAGGEADAGEIRTLQRILKEI